MSKPISPLEFKANIPDFVIDIVNEFIRKNIDRDGNAVLHITDIDDAISAEAGKNGDIWRSRYLDFEPYYRLAGWQVDFDNDQAVYRFKSNI